MLAFGINIGILLFLVFLIAAICFLAVFLFYRRRRFNKKLAEKLPEFQNQTNLFLNEYCHLINHFVQKTEENEFCEKWKNLFSEISKYHNSKKLRSFSQLMRFYEIYKNLHTNIWESNKEIKRKEEIKILSEQIGEFFAELSPLINEYVSHSLEIQFTQKWKELFRKSEHVEIKKDDAEYAETERFKSIFSSFHDYILNANEQFIQNEAKKYDALFSNIDGKSLDEQQRTAVICNEDRILTVAGAGSGKTLTVAAKVKYLCDVKKVDPKEILLISFTKKSALEMTERIRDKLAIAAEATTFHKLGLDIIKHAEGKRPNVSDESGLNQFVHDFFENELLNHPDTVKNLTEYFAYFLEIPNDMENYSSLGELYEDEKNADLETLKTKYDRQQYLKKANAEKSATYTTLQNEKVKSLEETKIANFLFMNNIKYEYEKLYPFASDDPMRKTYCPDFYLSDYDIYLEHFGITKDFTVPWLSPVEEQKYLNGIRWKRECHQKHNTKLLETYSYYNSDGILLAKLEEILKENNVVFRPCDFTDIFNTVYADKSNKYFSEFIKLCGTFIALFKSNNYKTEQIEMLQKQFCDEVHNKFLCNRTNLFLDIIKIVLNAYQKYLSDQNAVDFSDMINTAAEKVASGCEFPEYKYIIVDEYQDISKSRFSFLKAIADRTNAKVFCVGDDWQSIYRFAGSDVSLFTDFEHYFGYTKLLKIEKTYRNSQKLIDEAASFVLENPIQLKKDLKSDKQLDYPLVFWGFDDKPTHALKNIIEKIIHDFGTHSSVLLLGRTNYDAEILKKSGLFKTVYKNRKECYEYIFAPELPVEFLSVHKAKGIEADNVILLNFKNDRLGFPNRIADDMVLNLVLSKAETFDFAEERRLFYVAITRTKNRTFILTDNKNPSPFFKEFSESKSVCFVAIKHHSDARSTNCPHCKTGTLLKVEHNGYSFVGCSNFPKCTYTLRDASILLSPKKCPSCDGFLIKRKAKNGYWFCGCTNYPYCEYTESLK